MFPVLLAALFFMLAGLFYVTEMSSVLGAAEVGSRVAAGAAPAGAANATALDDVERRLPALLEPGLPGTHITYATSHDPTVDSCPPPQGERDAGNLVVCSRYGYGAATGSVVVIVRIYGRLPALFPGMPAFPVDEQAVVHSLAFQR